VACGAVVILCLATLTVAREAVWRSDLTMNRDVLKASNYPNNADAVNRLGRHYDRIGNLAGEEAAYRRGLDLSPDNRFILKNLGGVLIETGRIREAEEVLSRAFNQRQPQDRQKAAIAYNLSLALIALDQHAAAALVLEEAVLCKPPLVLAYRRLGRLYRDDLDNPERGANLIGRAEKIEAAAERGRTPD
jgi:tetratricopeptide (TPR) repeat protein